MKIKLSEGAEGVKVNLDSFSHISLGFCHIDYLQGEKNEEYCLFF
jgi:hypothetical protein